ncbi:MAG: hypothetical protein K1060chlam4_01198 [Candidatus Anoxychlamydiales bacterium]|nr:hypothetical protein [Candidatus Anoxychlamydiales bacterium]
MFLFLSTQSSNLSQSITNPKSFVNKQLSEMEKDATYIYKTKTRKEDTLSWFEKEGKWSPIIYKSKQESNSSIIRTDNSIIIHLLPNIKGELISSQLAVKWATRISEIDSEGKIEKKAMFEYVRLAFEKMYDKYLDEYQGKRNPIVQNFGKAKMIMEEFCSLTNVDREKTEHLRKLGFKI